MTKRLNVVADVSVTPLQVAVTSAPGSAGAAVAYSSASNEVAISNTSVGCKVQYKQTSLGVWQELGAGDGITLALNFASDTLYLRRATLDGGPASVGLHIEGAPVLRAGQDGGAIPIGGAGTGLWHASGVVADATPVVVALGGVATSVYRVSVNPAAGDSVLAEAGTSATGPWTAWPDGAVSGPDDAAFYPGTPATTHMRFTRTAGAGITSRFYVDEISNGA